MKKTIMITGSYPPDICGVGDYTYQVMQTEEATFWELYYSSDWSVGSLLKHIKKINRIDPSRIIMQYPTLGYGWSFIPHLLCIYYSVFTKKRFIVVLHEYSQQTLKHRIVLSLILLFSNQIVFTNQFEREYAIKKYCRLKKRSKIVKIYSNIESVSSILDVEDRKFDIVNFGLIRPHKGIEEYIRCISELRKTKPHLKALLIGQIPHNCQDYFVRIEEECKKNDILIKLNLSNQEVAEYLNNTKIAYLPFPDGVSERRGSFLAALKNGTVVVTTEGVHTTPEIKKCISLVPEHDAQNTILEYLSDNNLLKIHQEKGFSFLENEMPESWNSVAHDIVTK